jgi:hypothetical protein
MWNSWNRGRGARERVCQPSGLIACAECAPRAVYGVIATISLIFEPFVESGSVRGAKNRDA